jgi:hypothetical protein
VSHLIYNKILINFLKENKRKNKRKFFLKKKQTHWGGRPPHLSLGVASATPKGPKKKKI